jgi:hypothetical protein
VNVVLSSHYVMQGTSDALPVIEEADLLQGRGTTHNKDHGAERVQQEDQSLSRNQVLYGAAGQHNPRVAKAAKRRAKRASAGEKLAAADEDFDFGILSDSIMQT